MGLQHLAQPVGEDLELLGPAQGGVHVEVDLGQDAVKQQILELLFVADVVIQRAGDDPQAGGQAAHGQGLDTVLGDDRQRLGDHPFAGEPGTTVLIVVWAGRTTASVNSVGRGRPGCCPCALCWAVSWLGPARLP